VKVSDSETSSDDERLADDETETASEKDRLALLRVFDDVSVGLRLAVSLEVAVGSSVPRDTETETVLDTVPLSLRLSSWVMDGYDSVPNDREGLRETASDVCVTELVTLTLKLSVADIVGT
jgi:hypothetical protein